MVRVTSRAASTGRAHSVSSTAKRHRKQLYKIQYEQVTAKKKRLNLYDTNHTIPPPGYTFLSLGHADLAEHCKELSRKRGVDVSEVSQRPKNRIPDDPSRVSHHVHRIGYHFRSDLFDEACTWLGYRYHKGKLIRDAGGNLTAGFERTLARYGGNFENRAVATLEEGQKVKNAIRELFPRIPDLDLDEIFERAWQKGADTVGNAKNISFPRQVQLATIARIRHTYTDYDQRLRMQSWHDARAAVEPLCLAKLVEWRGDNENNEDEIEDILQETIVIDDSDATDDGQDDNDADNEGASDTSVEIIAQTVKADDLEYERIDPRWLQLQSTSVRRRLGTKNRLRPGQEPSDTRAQSQRAHASQYDGRGGGGGGAFTPDFRNSNLSSDLQNPNHINVPLDYKGKAPRRVFDGGIEYIRIDEDNEAQQGFPPPLPQWSLEEFQRHNSMYGRALSSALPPSDKPFSEEPGWYRTSAPEDIHVLPTTETGFGHFNQTKRPRDDRQINHEMACGEPTPKRTRQHNFAGPEGRGPVYIDLTSPAGPKETSRMPFAQRNLVVAHEEVTPYPLGMSFQNTKAAYGRPGDIIEIDFRKRLQHSKTTMVTGPRAAFRQDTAIFGQPAYPYRRPIEYQSPSLNVASEHGVLDGNWSSSRNSERRLDEPRMYPQGEHGVPLYQPYEQANPPRSPRYQYPTGL